MRKAKYPLPERELHERTKRHSSQLLEESTQGKGRMYTATTIPGASTPGISTLSTSPSAMPRAHDLRTADILSLQRTAGNRAVQRLLAAPQSAPKSTSGAQSSERSTHANTGPAPSRHIATLSSQPKQTVQRAPHAKVTGRAPAGHLQRAGNWQKFKNFAKGQGQGFRNDQQWWLDEMNPTNNKGVGKVTKPLMASPFALLQMGLSGVGRGLTTLGAGAYYGAKGLGSGAMSLGKGIGRGAKSLGNSIKTAYNKDRNPHGYDRNRLPATANTRMEIAKPAAALGISGATLGGVKAADSASGFPAGAGMLNLISAADAGLTWYNGAKRAEAAKKRNDIAGEKVGNRKANQGKWALMGGVAGTAQGALNLGTAIDVGSKGVMGMNNLVSSASYVSSGLGVAGAAAGIAGGAITAGQGMWKAGKAFSKWHKLSKSEPMLTEEGDHWRGHIKNREKTKAGLNTLKAIGGALGIAAGALIIASNPVGWALGIAAAATAGGLVAYKLYTKWKKSKRKQQAKHTVREEMEQEQQSAMPELEDIEDNNDPQQGQDEAGMREADPTKLDQAKRKQAHELGNRVAQKASKSGKVAGEIRGALAARGDPMLATLNDCLTKKQFSHAELRQINKKDYPFPKHVLRVHDALVMLSVLNLTPEQVESESGQELIEKKLSVSDSL